MSSLKFAGFVAASLVSFLFDSNISIAVDLQAKDDICRICNCDHGHVNCLEFKFAKKDGVIVFNGPVSTKNLPETIRQLEAVQKSID